MTGETWFALIAIGIPFTVMTWSAVIWAVVYLYRDIKEGW